MLTNRVSGMVPFHVAWFSGAPVQPCETEGLTSPDLDVCTRCLSPARELEKLGIACSVFGNLEDADPTHVSKHLQKLSTDIVVIGKMSHTSLLKFARAAKHLGCYVVADFSKSADLPIDRTEFLGITDLFITATSAMAKAMAKGKERDSIQTLSIPDADMDNPLATAKLWLKCFKKLKEKPPACANSNQPLAAQEP